MTLNTNQLPPPFQQGNYGLGNTIWGNQNTIPYHEDRKQGRGTDYFNQNFTPSHIHQSGVEHHKTDGDRVVPLNQRLHPMLSRQRMPSPHVEAHRLEFTMQQPPKFNTRFNPQKYVRGFRF